MTTKKDLASVLRREFGFSWSESYSIIETLLSALKTSLRAHNSVSLRRFGTFETTSTTTKRFRHIHTGKMIMKIIPPRVRFKPSKHLLKP